MVPINLICVILLLIVWPKTNANFFTSLAKMEPLIKTQATVIKNIEPYVSVINNQFKRQLVETYLAENKKEQILAKEKGTAHYLGNPISAFTLIKRLTHDLDCVEKILHESTGYKKNIMVDYPSNNDLTGALESIASLQIFYKLKISHLANGTLIGNFSKTKQRFVEYVTPMTASDCFQIGLIKYADKDYTKKVLWMKEALRKYRAGSKMCGNTEEDIIDQISEGYYEMGSYNDCMYWVKKRMAMAPSGHHTAAFKKFIEHLQMKITEQRRNQIMQRENVNKTRKDPTTYTATSDEAFCSEESDLHVSKKRLKCYYAHGPHPYLILARIKAEKLHSEPDIMMYHNVISDKEIWILKSLATPKELLINPYLETDVNILRPATVTNSTTGNVMQDPDYRISQVAWVSDDASEIVARISRRVSHITGFTVDDDSAEEIQVANYGIAGCYFPHYDFVNIFNKRLASFMFYMSNVELGGATAFTKLGLTIFPVKYAAIYWKNLHPSGEKHYGTLHGACPVLRGTKWVAIKWISLAGQELISPCPADLKLTKR